VVKTDYDHSMRSGYPIVLQCITAVLPLLASLAVSGEAADPGVDRVGKPPFAIPTFHCLGLYWSPAGGGTNRQVLVRYRQAGGRDWRAALPMRYHPIPNTDEDLADYRGSIVYLTPAATYEVQLTLEGTTTATNLTATTWSGNFPVGEAIQVADRTEPLALTESGTSTAWRVYDGRGTIIDVRHRHDACVTINASHIILRGFTLRGAGATNLAPRRTIGAILIEGGHDIVI